jgi:hypothetical protein
LATLKLAAPMAEHTYGWQIIAVASKASLSSTLSVAVLDPALVF